MTTVNDMMVNGLTLAEHRELGRGITATLDALDKLEARAAGHAGERYAMIRDQIDGILDELADKFTEAYQADGDPYKSGDYPYPLFGIGGEIVPTHGRGGLALR